MGFKGDWGDVGKSPLYRNEDYPTIRSCAKGADLLSADPCTRSPGILSHMSSGFTTEKPYLLKDLEYAHFKSEEVIGIGSGDRYNPQTRYYMNCGNSPMTGLKWRRYREEEGD